MKTRRIFGSLLIAAGLGLCLAAGIHYLRGSLAQTQGRAQFEAILARPAAAVPSPRPAPRENPGIVSASAPGPPPAATYPYGQPIARIRIPSAEIDAVVFGGSDSAMLEKGPGHVPGTALPGADGPPHNCVITGHRDSHFRHLGWLRPGHTIELDTPSGSSTYRIIQREIVRPDAVSVLAPTEKPRLTLITCYPFNYIGPAPQRLVLIAEPVGPRFPRHRS
jgi:sortase A